MGYTPQLTRHTPQPAHRALSSQHTGMEHIGRQPAARYSIARILTAHIISIARILAAHIISIARILTSAPAPIEAAIDTLGTADTAAPTDTIATAITGDNVKVSELKEGMLLRFKEPRIYKYLRDTGDSFWLDCGALDPRMTLKWVQTGQPLMIYLGQEKMEIPSNYGGYFNVRKVSVEGREAWMWPDAWRYVEAV